MLYQFDKSSLTYKKITNRLVWISIGIVFAVSFITSLIAIHHLPKSNYITEETRAIILAQEDEFTPERLKNYLKQLNVKYPDIVYAQAEIESGQFSSQVFRENKNLFGMRLSNGRPSTCKGCVNTYACYNSWRESVLDYAFYQAAYLGNIHTQEQYLQYLGQNYAEDTNYVMKIRHIITRK